MIKIKAVTIIEMIVSMIIFSVFIGIGYYAFEVLDKYVVSYIKRSKVLAEGVELQYLLQKDFEKADRIFITGDSAMSLFSMADTVEYRFSGNMVDRRITGGEIQYPFDCQLSQIEQIQIESEFWLNSVVIKYNAGTIFCLPIRKIYSSEQIVNYVIEKP